MTAARRLPGTPRRWLAHDHGDSAEGPGAWTRVANVVESQDSVTVVVRSFLVRLGPGTAEAVQVRSTVTLRDPVAGRTVIDGSTGVVVPQDQP